jgi:hypothetical protein
MAKSSTAYNNPQEHGDADYFLLEHYIPEELLCQSRGNGEEEAELRWRLRAQHEARQGLDPGRAEENFISAVQRLPDHGIHFFHAHQVHISIPFTLMYSFMGI